MEYKIGDLINSKIRGALILMEDTPSYHNSAQLSIAIPEASKLTL